MSGLDLARQVGLRLGEGKKFFELIDCPTTEIEKILREKISEGIFVAWQVQSVTWGKFDGERLLLKDDAAPDLDQRSCDDPDHVVKEAAPDLDDWLECRIFNRQEEIHLKRAGNNFVGRFVRDEAGTGTFYVDSFSRLWGERTAATGDWITLTDAPRKISMTLPCAVVDKKSYGLLTRNYIGSDAARQDATGLSGYVDYRFVAIEPADWDGD